MTNQATLVPSLSIIVPVLNEADNIATLLAEIDSTFKGRDVELIYINDGSTDDTLTILEQSKPDYPYLRIISFSNTCGQSAAMRAGALAARADVIGFLDGDLQNPPGELLKLEELLLAQRPLQGLAAGIRKNRAEGAGRRFVSRSAFTIRKILFADSHPDTGCSLKVVDKALFVQIPYFRHMHRFIPILIGHVGGVVVGADVTDRPRVAGKSKYTNFGRALVGLVDLLGVFWLMRVKIPEKVEER